MGAFFLLARGAVGVLFFDLLEKHLLVSDGRCWFQMLVDIWKRVHKKSEASDAFSSWCFFGLNEVAFFLMCCLFHQISHVLELFCFQFD